MGFSYTTPSELPLVPPAETWRAAGSGCSRMPSGQCRGRLPPIPVSTSYPLSRRLPSQPYPFLMKQWSGISEKTKIERGTKIGGSGSICGSGTDQESEEGLIPGDPFPEDAGQLERIPIHLCPTLVSVSVTAMAEEAGESEVGWEFDYSHFFSDLDVERVGRSAGKKALERLGGKRIPSGTYPVLLRNHVASEFLGLLAHSFLSDQVQKGKSFLKGRKGERIFSSLLSFVDDGLLPEGDFHRSHRRRREAQPADRLGPSREVSGYLYDRYWANRENRSSSDGGRDQPGTAGAPASRRLPGIGVSNFFIEPGRLTASGLVKELHRGLVLEDVMGLHTVDPISGDFSLGCSGDWVERGEKVHPVKSIAVAGNLFELFSKVVGVGEDLRFFGGIGSPSLLIDGIEVSGN